jgi:aspartate/methionine/tyrosine aminotransferase
VPDISQRAKLFGESVIRRMSRVAARFDAVNLAQGFPDFDPPAELTDALARVAPVGPHQYAVTWGSPAFRKALTAKQNHFTGLNYDPDQNVVVTCGSTEAMMAAMLALVNPGDKVVVFSPFYENYGADAILSGAEPIYVPLVPPAFGFDREKLRAAFAQKPKAIIVCNPSNPTGKVFSRSELEFIHELAAEHDAWVVTDEVYEHIVFAPHEHISFASLPGAFDRSIVVGSLSKTYSITGWRLGFAFGPARAIEALRKTHDFLTVGAAAPLMEAAVAGLNLPDSYYDELRAEYTGKRDLFLGLLDQANLHYTRPDGAYYVLVDVSEFDATDDTRFCEWLTEHVGVAAVPGSSFFREPVNHLIRFHFAKKDETLIEAGRRLARLRQVWAEKGYGKR